jgi:hypothetical protein
MTDLLAEAREYTDGWVTEPDGPEPWRPFDQAERIRHWRDSWETDDELREFNADVQKWEDAHGHDVRLKCYPEFQCSVIESYGANLIQRLVSEIETLRADRIELIGQRADHRAGIQ